MEAAARNDIYASLARHISYGNGTLLSATWQEDNHPKVFAKSSFGNTCGLAKIAHGKFPVCRTPPQKLVFNYLVYE